MDLGKPIKIVRVDPEPRPAAIPVEGWPKPVAAPVPVPQPSEPEQVPA